MPTDDKPTDDKAVVFRVVRGKLLYVLTDAGDPWVFKLDQLLVQDSRGRLRPYRGEPLADLGLRKGSNVIVRDLHSQNPLIIVRPPSSKGVIASVQRMFR